MKLHLIPVSKKVLAIGVGLLFFLLHLFQNLSLS